MDLKDIVTVGKNIDATKLHNVFMEDKKILDSKKKRQNKYEKIGRKTEISTEAIRKRHKKKKNAITALLIAGALVVGAGNIGKLVNVIDEKNEQIAAHNMVHDINTYLVMQPNERVIEGTNIFEFDEAGYVDSIKKVYSNEEARRAAIYDIAISLYGVPEEYRGNMDPKDSMDKVVSSYDGSENFDAYATKLGYTDSTDYIKNEKKVYNAYALMYYKKGDAANKEYEYEEMIKTSASDIEAPTTK